MRLLAIRAVYSSVSVIPVGSIFEELNDERAKNLIQDGSAVVPENRKNSRGWNELFWDGCSVAIIASGPSLTRYQCDEVRAWRDAKADERKVIVINSSFRLAPWADILYCCDGVYFEALTSGVKHIDEARRHFAASNIWTQEQSAATKYGLKYVRSARVKGLSITPGLINQGANSGYQAMNLAFLAGAVRLILLGFDMREIAGKHHFFGDHPPTIKRVMPYKAWVEAFNPIARDLTAQNVEVINCTPGSALKVFPIVELAEALK